MKRPTLRGTTLAILAAASTANASTVCHVDDDAPPAGDGTSWATAFRFLRDAVDHASNPPNDISEIRVAGGLYVPDRDEACPEGSGDRGATFELAGGLVFRGGYLGLSAGAGESPDDRDPAQWPSVLSGDLAGDDGPGGVNTGDNSYHVITAVLLDAVTTLDGLSITAGNADGPTPDDRGGAVYAQESPLLFIGCTFAANAAGGASSSGGAIYVLSGSPTLVGCTFTGNSCGYEGGAIYTTPTSVPLIMACVFDGNAAASRGGAMRNSGSSPTVLNCTFTGNASVEGGAVHNSGVSSPAFSGCTFTGNVADSRGGAMFNNAFADADVFDCTFTQNTAGSTGGGMRNFASHPTVTGCEFTDNHAEEGGGMANWLGSPTVLDTVFWGNTADLGGGMYNLNGSDPVVTGCTFAGNLASGAGGGMHNHSSSPALSGCVFVGNGADEGGGLAADLVSNPVIADSTFLANDAASLGGGVFSRNGGGPQLIGCTMRGNTAGLAGGAVATVLSSPASIADSLLCENDPNHIEGSWNDDGGNTLLDACPDTCPGDLTADGVVDITDLLIVIVGWGDCSPDCQGDVDGDGDVDINDFLTVVGAWGPCPAEAAAPGGRAGRPGTRPRPRPTTRGR